MLTNERDRGTAADHDEGRTTVLERNRGGEVIEEREDKRAWGGPPLVRALFTLLGVGIAGFLIWLASRFALDDTEEFWVAMGLVATGGLALGLSQLFGGWTKWGMPVLSPGVFFLAFVPTALAVGWILLATQPQGGWQQGRLEGWSDDIGVLGFVQDVGLFAPALALGLGLVLAFSFDTTGPRQAVVKRTEPAVPDEDVHDLARREPARTTEPDEQPTVVHDPDATIASGTTGEKSAPWDRPRDLT